MIGDFYVQELEKKFEWLKDLRVKEQEEVHKIFPYLKKLYVAELQLRKGESSQDAAKASGMDIKDVENLLTELEQGADAELNEVFLAKHTALCKFGSIGNDFSAMLRRNRNTDFYLKFADEIHECTTYDELYKNLKDYIAKTSLFPVE